MAGKQIEQTRSALSAASSQTGTRGGVVPPHTEHRGSVACSAQYVTPNAIASTGSSPFSRNTPVVIRRGTRHRCETGGCSSTAARVFRSRVGVRPPVLELFAKMPPHLRPLVGESRGRRIHFPESKRGCASGCVLDTRLGLSLRRKGLSVFA